MTTATTFIAHHKYFTDKLENNNNNGGTNKIPLGARVIAVADAYDAMTTGSALYRKSMPPWEVFQEIVAKTGKQFDPRVVEVFKRVVSEKLERG